MKGAFLRSAALGSGVEELTAVPVGRLDERRGEGRDQGQSSEPVCARLGCLTRRVHIPLQT